MNGLNNCYWSKPINIVTYPPHKHCMSVDLIASVWASVSGWSGGWVCIAI